MFKGYQVSGAKPAQGNMDYLLLLCVLALTAIGLIMVYSSSAFFAMEKAGNQFAYLKKQFLFVVVGIVAMLIMSKVPYRFWHRTIGFWLGLCAVLLLLVLVPFLGHKELGARRWFSIGGFFLQPTELAKPVLVAYTAYILARVKDPSVSWLRTVAKPLIPAVLMLGLIYLEPDFGTLVIITAIMVAMVFVSGLPLRYLAVVSTVIAILAIPVVAFSDYRMKRVEGYLDQLSFIGGVGDYGKLGYHVRENIISFGSGRLWGMDGLGGGVHKMFFLPQAHADSILATVGQEGGFVLVSIVLLLYGLLLYRGFRIAWNSPDLFGGYLAFGLTFTVLMHVTINVGAVTGLLPPKGTILPFVSYGGSSLVAMFGAAGMLLQLSRHTVKKAGSTGKGA